MLPVDNGKTVQKIFSILGLPKGSSEATIDATCKRLTANLGAAHFAENSKASEQAEICRRKIELAYKEFCSDRSASLHDYDPSDGLDSQSNSRPRLGQLCVASGMISIDQLEEAVEAQISDKLPLGEILQAKKFISQAELDALLLGQQMIDVPNVESDLSTHRLVLLGIATEDMILVMQMEQKTLGSSIRELLVKHHWAELSVLDAVEYKESDS